MRNQETKPSLPAQILNFEFLMASNLVNTFFSSRLLWKPEVDRTHTCLSVEFRADGSCKQFCLEHEARAKVKDRYSLDVVGHKTLM